MWKSWVRRDSVDTRPLVEATYRFFQNEPNAFGSGGDDDDDEAAASLFKSLASIQVSTLVLAGRHSSVLGSRNARIVVSQLPRAKLIEFEQSSHALQLEEPEAFQRAVAAFVNGRAECSKTSPGR
jgi:pimeloyl-ACP methyl ester carboxylesterase